MARKKPLVPIKSAPKARNPEEKRMNRAERKPLISNKPVLPKGRNPEENRTSSSDRKPLISNKSLLPKGRNPDEKRASSAERSSYFARREAAKVLRSTLQGDVRLRAAGSIKSLVYSPSVRNKRATFALVCQTLKHLSVIKNVLEEANVLSAKWKKQEELMYIIIYDILFGKEGSLMGDAEKYLMLKKETLLSALSRILKRKGVKTIQDLVAIDKTSDLQKPRYIRVNTLKIDTETAISELRQQYKVEQDDLVPDLLVLPPGADLHNHPLVKNRSIFMQGKASSMAAIALGPKPGWKVIDACSAPGNKTLHLAALVKGKGKVIACELDKKRFEHLKDNVKLAGATNVRVKLGDFLKLDPKDPSYSNVRAILLDPSCSGSGTAVDRLDHLLPSYSADHVDINRLRKLAGFQKKVLEHAFLFVEVERIVYSTCSIHQIENEDVVHSVLDLAASHGFQLETAFPNWPRRGLPTFDGSQHLLRTHIEEDKEGFFIALFVKKGIHVEEEEEEEEDNERKAENHSRTKCAKGFRRPLNHFVAKMLKLQMHF